MDWYYVRGEERVGPIGEAEFQALAESGVVNASTLVWNADMTDWRPFGELGTPTLASAGAGDIDMGAHLCAECGLSFPSDEMVRFQDMWVCARCKPVFFQRLREGGELPTQLRYAGFWIRFVAKFIDGILVGVVNMFVMVVLGQSFDPGSAPASPLFFLSLTASSLFGFALQVGYATFFIGKFAATPGKMACGLKVVRTDGGTVSYWRAFGRYFGEMLSGLILYIGYIMAAFDEEKRALHDRICDTRVVYK